MKIMWKLHLVSNIAFQTVAGKRLFKFSRHDLKSRNEQKNVQKMCKKCAKNVQKNVRTISGRDYEDTDDKDQEIKNLKKEISRLRLRNKKLRSGYKKE